MLPIRESFLEQVIDFRDGHVTSEYLYRNSAATQCKQPQQTGAGAPTSPTCEHIMSLLSSDKLLWLHAALQCD